MKFILIALALVASSVISKRILSKKRDLITYAPCDVEIKNDQNGQVFSCYGACAAGAVITGWDDQGAANQLWTPVLYPFSQTWGANKTNTWALKVKGTELYLTKKADRTMTLEAWTAGHEEMYKWDVETPHHTFRAHSGGKIDVSQGHYHKGGAIMMDRFHSNAWSPSEKWTFKNVATPYSATRPCWIH